MTYDFPFTMFLPSDEGKVKSKDSRLRFETALFRYGLQTQSS